MSYISNTNNSAMQHLNRGTEENMKRMLEFDEFLLKGTKKESPSEIVETTMGDLLLPISEK
tara:strand:+ start:5221 stop:5403 length:183 start_codon:yes stop_codon:yes gene_type:complete